MLKSIEKLKGLGVYQSYSKPAGTQDFGGVRISVFKAG